MLSERNPDKRSKSGNGRMYDPLVGRFLSADNYVQDPTSSQSYNRYSYGLNNPLKYSDPSGMLLVPNNPAVNAYFTGMQTAEFNNSGGGASGGGGVNGDGGSSWYNAYIEATLHGYTDGMKTFFNQLNSPKFNGTSYVYITQGESYIDEDGAWVTKAYRHTITISPKYSESVGGGHYCPMDIGLKFNELVDKTGTLTSVNIYSVQKVAGVAAKDMAKLTTLTLIGRVTGIATIVDNSMKFWEDPSANWWNGVEAVGQSTAISIGWVTGEEIELIYNGTTLTIDFAIMAVNKHNQEHP